MYRKLVVRGFVCLSLLLLSVVAGTAACTVTGINLTPANGWTITAGGTFSLLTQVACAGQTIQFVLPSGVTASGGSATSGTVEVGPTGDNGQASLLLQAPMYNGVYPITVSVKGTDISAQWNMTVTGGQAGGPTTPGYGVYTNAIQPASGFPTYQVALPQQQVSFGVVVYDATGQPASGAYVNFQAPAGFTAITQTLVQTQTTGYAQAFFAAPAQPGLYTVNVTGVYQNYFPAAFSVCVGTNCSSTGGGGGGSTPGTGTGGVSIVSGNGQVASQFFPFPKPLVVQVKDQTTGQPVPNAQVTWTVSSGAGPTINCYASQSCVQNYAGSVTTTTDSNGQSSVNATAASGFLTGTLTGPQQSTISAATATGSATFFLTTLPTVSGQPATLQVQLVQPAAGSTITGAAGSTIPGAIQARAISGYSALANVGLDVSTGNTPGTGPTASCANAALSDASGTATCDLVLGPKMGTAQLQITMGGSGTQTVTLEVTQGAPAAIQVAQGDGQSGTAGQTLPLALVGVVTDPGGNPLSSVPVTWEIVTPNSVSLVNTSNGTDYNGRASTSVKLGSIPGTFKVNMKAGNVTATFNVTVNTVLGPISKVSGDAQSAVVGQQFAQPVVVQVKDQNGAAISGITVTFTATGGTVATANATTDASGNASTAVTAGANAGAVTVSAAAGNVTPVSFNLTARLPGPTLSAQSFMNGAGFQVGVVPGSIVTIQGAGVAPGIQNCVSSNMEGPMPMTLGGVQVLFGSVQAPLYSVCNQNGVEQATVQAPFEIAPGPITVTVRIQGGSTTVNNVQVLPAQPGIFQYAANDGRLYGVVARPDGSFVGPANPARRGETVRMYVTGLGAVTPAAATNTAGVPGQTLSNLPIVGVNNAGVRVISAEYAQNMIGVYVVTFEIPADATASTDLPLSIAVIGPDQAPVYSNASRIAVQ